MTYARLRDVLNTMSRDELSQEAVYLAGEELKSVDVIDSFRGDKKFASKFGGQPHQVFLTGHKEL